MDTLLPFDKYLDLVAPIVRLYVGWFNHTPDPDGLAYWAHRVRSGESLDLVCQAFQSAATDQPSGNDDFVAMAYQRLLGRLPDASGAAHYVEQLECGNVTRADVMLSFAQSGEALGHLHARVLVAAAAIGLTGHALNEAEASAFVARVAAGEAEDLVIADIVLSARGT